MAKHFLTLMDYDSEQLQNILQLAEELKAKYAQGQSVDTMQRKTMAMIFEKPSSRTRVSFEVGCNQLGGSTIYLRPEDIGGLGKREPIRDLVRVLNGMANVIVARTFKHSDVEELAKWATIPVINALTDKYHPCQAMADVLTIKERFGDMAGRKVAYIGDGNNVAVSLAIACVRFGMNFAIAHPQGYALPDEFVQQISSQLDKPNQIQQVSDCYAAVKDADVIYTDTWTSMGQEEEKQQRIKDFAGYQVNRKLLDAAKPEACVMHCLPAYRDLEITDEIVDCDQSVIFQQAENRLHAQRALLHYLLD